MGLLTNDMTRLRDEIDTLHNMRAAFVNDLTEGVSNMKADFRNAHAEMAEKLTGDLRTFVSELRRNVSQMQSGFRNDHAEMAEKLIDDLKTFVLGLKADVSKMKKAFRNEHCEMAEKLTGDLRTFVSELRRNVSQMQSGFRHDHTEMANKLIRDLATFASDLNKTVTNLRQEFADDIAGAHQAWFRQAPAAGIPTQQTKPEKTEELTPDDLTTISGIGQGMQRRLNNAGIYTCAQLARTTPEHLHRILGRMGAMMKVEQWIAQAKELAGSA